ncbi:VOC family protein [Pseudooctadecabacter jejudonensis]|uniref:Glyoxalase/Bleomycin resistance protein/Dioxygenase superfamily protein n=1 Tax=Pseudooctadecabacter jejudonensis TaxID=1391910 RepID=A0A1Y5SZ30_9RHOB|nr:VOC family protein [Pseudooctadecabacter jejudonensis]SLN51965.1 Glyoxalase/Bleomycin resistance protein/Dioxygenase superfamily protein [Pseudooctadecabacter jejudonensis]
MALTTGLNHLGLTVRDLDQTTSFFVDVLGWDVTARDASYPRTTVTDGVLRLTLWQVQTDQAAPFDRKGVLGLHHLALQVPDMNTLTSLADVLTKTKGVVVEFMPEPMGAGPRVHMMFAEPGGLRIELLYNPA